MSCIQRFHCISYYYTITQYSLHVVAVAVKILHPGVHTSISRDLNIMKFVANLMDKIYPNFYWVSLKECVDEFSFIMEKQVQ